MKDLGQDLVIWSWGAGAGRGTAFVAAFGISDGLNLEC